MIKSELKDCRPSLGIMQPYFLPYIGYFQLIAAVDEFVIYDNIKYTKKGWINRNRFLRNGSDEYFSLPLKNASDDLYVSERVLADVFDRQKFLRQLHEAYRKAPQYSVISQLLETVVAFEDNNLFRFILNSVEKVCLHIGIDTPIKISSSVSIDHGQRAQDKVLAICNARGALVYINPIGGVDLYDRDVFVDRGIELKFIRSRPFEYRQFGDGFVPWLSILDVLMFNPRDHVRDFVIGHYELV